MDTHVQLYESEAAGWQRGLYEDVKRTFRVPFVFWVFRTTMANEPEFLRYAWGQIKPVFQTQAMEDYAATYRDAVLSTVGEDRLPVYRSHDLGLRPPEYRELTNQVETFDVGAPRLALLFHLVDTALDDGPVGTDPRTDRAATEPRDVATDRRVPPTMIPFDDVPDELAETIDAITAFHGFDEGLPSVYRCLAQWPSFLERVWNDLEPVLTSDAFDRCREIVDSLVTDFVRTTSYRPRLAPDVLRAAGFEEETIEGARELFRHFRYGPVRTVIPTLPLLAYSLDVSGPPQR